MLKTTRRVNREKKARSLEVFGEEGERPSRSAMQY
jgi:hypothetical protein